MVTATVLTLLPVVIVGGITARAVGGGSSGTSEPFPRRRRRRWKMNAPFDLAAATEAYAAYLNAPRGVLAPAEQQILDEDLAKARAAVETAWLRAKPVRQPD